MKIDTKMAKMRIALICSLAAASLGCSEWSFGAGVSNPTPSSSSESRPPGFSANLNVQGATARDAAAADSGASTDSDFNQRSSTASAPARQADAPGDPGDTAAADDESSAGPTDMRWREMVERIQARAGEAAAGSDGKYARQSNAQQRLAERLPEDLHAGFEDWLRGGLARLVPVDFIPELPPNSEPIFCLDIVALPQPIFFEANVALDAAGAAPSQRAAEFSTTNVQEGGVDESDRVKFDGEVLYVAPRFDHFYPHFPVPLPIPPGCGGIFRRDVLVDSAFAPPPERPEIAAEIRILRTSEDPAAVEQIASLTIPESAAIHGLYVTRFAGPAESTSEESAADDGSARQLIAVGSDNGWSWADLEWGSPWGWSWSKTTLRFFDVRDPSMPQPTKSLSIEGQLVSSRRVGDTLYVVTRHTPILNRVHPNPLERRLALHNRSVRDLDILGAPANELMPRVTEDGGKPHPLHPIRACFLPAAEAAKASEEASDIASADYALGMPTLLSITAVSLRDPSKRTSVCLGGVSSEIYSSTESLYVTSSLGYRWWSPDARERTRVYKFAYTGDGPEYRGFGTVPGRLAGVVPRYSLGEHAGALGIVTDRGWMSPLELGEVPTPEQSRYALSVLREADAENASHRPDVHGGLERIAVLPSAMEPEPIGKPGEQIHGVRFVGDRIYVVTYRNIDPLYAIDWADPGAPYIAGQLEVPGFSDYLHPISADLLLGIGKATVVGENNDWFQGVKLELFDVSDPRDLASVSSVVVGRRGTQSSALTDPHAVAHLPAGPGGVHRIALPIEVHDEGSAVDESPWSYHAWTATGLHLFHVDEGAAPHEARIKGAGVLVTAEADSAPDPSGYTPWQRITTQGDRAVIDGDAVHYVRGSGVWSADWDAPESPVGPQ